MSAVPASQRVFDGDVVKQKEYKENKQLLLWLILISVVDAGVSQCYLTRGGNLW